MQESHLILFAAAKPFEPFIIYIVDGRRLDVTHPESILLTEYGLGIWIFHPKRQVEIVEATMIASLKTLGGVDPGEYLPMNL